MKIQCDVCGKEDASVFCCADEAALCDPCDRRVHRANKLAGKHRRFSLLHPTSPALAPRCDVCQEKRAFLFCQEDRAILCRDCDGPIHSANELTMKHSRYLLTGVKLSSTATAADESDEAGVVAEEEETKNKKVGQQAADPVGAQITKSCNKSCKSTSNSVITSDKAATVSPEVESGGGDSSSISDYLIKTLPGWCVDDLLLDYPSPTSNSPFPSASALAAPAFCRMGIGGVDLHPFVEADLDSGGLGGGDTPVWWVPQVPQVPPQTTAISFHYGGATADPAGQQRWRSDDGFTVPQIISQPPPSNKRSRSMWYS